MAGPRGIEPRPTDLEAVVLPLNYRPKGTRVNVPLSILSFNSRRSYARVVFQRRLHAIRKQHFKASPPILRMPNCRPAIITKKHCFGQCFFFYFLVSLNITCLRSFLEYFLSSILRVTSFLFFEVQ